MAAILSGTGAPALLLDAAFKGRFELVVCPHLLAELRRVLSRDKFKERLTEGEADDYVSQIASHSHVQPDPAHVAPVSADPDDDYLVALATESGAQYLVSGDAHLTDLVDLDPAVVTPREFLENLSD